MAPHRAGATNVKPVTLTGIISTSSLYSYFALSVDAHADKKPICCWLSRSYCVRRIN